MADMALLESLHPEAEALLAAHHALRRGLHADVRGVGAIITRGAGRVTAGMLHSAGPSLRCVARVGAGTEHIDLVAATAAGIPVLYTPDAFTQSTAEHALALLLAVCRRVPELAAAAAAADWAAREGVLGLDLAGRRIGIVGLGRIGRRFGEMAQALGMDVCGWSRASRHPGFTMLELDELLRTSDVVSLHLALEPETVGFLDAARIARLKPGAVLINVARGGLVDEHALGSALRAGRLRGAGLDVLAREPPAADHPLLHLPGVVVTPHIAALTEPGYRVACLRIAAATLGWLRGAPPDPALVRNPEAWAVARGAVDPFAAAQGDGGGGPVSMVASRRVLMAGIADPAAHHEPGDDRRHDQPEPDGCADDLRTLGEGGPQRDDHDQHRAEGGVGVAGQPEAQPVRHVPLHVRPVLQVSEQND